MISVHIESNWCGPKWHSVTHIESNLHGAQFMMVAQCNILQFVRSVRAMVPSPALSRLTLTLYPMEKNYQTWSVINLYIESILVRRSLCGTFLTSHSLSSRAKTVRSMHKKVSCAMHEVYLQSRQQLTSSCILKIGTQKWPCIPAYFRHHYMHLQKSKRQVKYGNLFYKKNWRSKIW